MADRQTAYSVSIFGSAADSDPHDAPPSRIQQALVDFVMEFHLHNIFIYRSVETPQYREHGS